MYHSSYKCQDVWGSGTANERLAVAYADFCSWCKLHKIVHSQPKFTTKILRSKDGEVELGVKAYNAPGPQINGSSKPNVLSIGL